MAVLSELQIDILSNFGNIHIVFDEIIFKDATGNPLSNTGIVLTTNSNLNSSGWELQKLLNGLYSSGSSIQGWASFASPTYPVWLKCVFPVGFDCASVTLVNRSDSSDSTTSPKDITITALDATYGNTYTLSATRPSDAAGAFTTHNLADAVYAPIVKRGIKAQFPSLAPAANYGAPIARAIQITLSNYNTVYGGAYKKEGFVIEDSIPVQRKVYLLNNLNGQIAFTTWSDKNTGEYVFNNISKGPFILFAVDHNDKFDITGKSGVLGD